MKNECSSCKFKTKCKKYPHRDMYGETKKSHWLCELCASTMAGASLDWTHSKLSNQELIQAICFVGNVTLSKLPIPNEGEQDMKKQKWNILGLIVGATLIGAGTMQTSGVFMVFGVWLFVSSYVDLH